MRYDHPRLASIALGETNVYEVPDTIMLDTWMKETFIVAPVSATKESLLASFRPSPQATLHYLPHRSEIVIHSSHWRIDGIGAIALLHNLFKAMSEPLQIEFGSEGKNLSASRDQAANYRSLDQLQSPAMANEKVRAATDLVMELTDNMLSIGLPAKNVTHKPGGTYRSEVILDLDTTRASISAIKQRGVTVTAAVHAALLIALKQISVDPAPKSNVYTSWGIWNVRPKLRAPFNDTFAHPATVSVVGLPLTLRLSTYTDLALELTQYYKERGPAVYVDEDTVVPFTNQMADMTLQPPPPELPVLSEPMLSSMGVVDDYLKPTYGDIHIEDFWTCVEQTTPQVWCGLQTWQGKLILSAAYNETFYSKDLMDNFLDSVIHVLLTEMGIPKA